MINLKIFMKRKLHVLKNDKINILTFLSCWDSSNTLENTIFTLRLTIAGWLSCELWLSLKLYLYWAGLMNHNDTWFSEHFRLIFISGLYTSLSMEKIQNCKSWCVQDVSKYVIFYWWLKNCFSTWKLDELDLINARPYLQVLEFRGIFIKDHRVPYHLVDRIISGILTLQGWAIAWWYSMEIFSYIVHLF